MELLGFAQDFKAIVPVFAVGRGHSANFIDFAGLADGVGGNGQEAVRADQFGQAAVKAGAGKIDAVAGLVANVVGIGRKEIVLAGKKRSGEGKIRDGVGKKTDAGSGVGAWQGALAEKAMEQSPGPGSGAAIFAGGVGVVAEQHGFPLVLG